MVAYDQLAAVYDWLVADDMLSPEGSVAAHDAVVAALPRGARVLDCAAGTGLLAVGLAERGFGVVASDASPAMIARTRALAADALAGSIFRMLRQGQRVVFDLDDAGQATRLRLGSEVDMQTPGA